MKMGRFVLPIWNGNVRIAILRILTYTIDNQSILCVIYSKSVQSAKQKATLDLIVLLRLGLFVSIVVQSQVRAKTSRRMRTVYEVSYVLKLLQLFCVKRLLFSDSFNQQADKAKRRTDMGQTRAK